MEPVIEDDGWTKDAVENMTQLDSFLKDSQRLYRNANARKLLLHCIRRRQLSLLITVGMLRVAQKYPRFLTGQRLRLILRLL